MNPEETYSFYDLTSAQVGQYIEDGKFFNRQKLGLKVKDFQNESKIKQRLNIVSTFKTSDAPSNGYSIVDTEEYVAMLESPDFSLYAVTYDIEYT